MKFSKQAGKKMHPDIEKRKEDLRVARDNYDKALLKVQFTCLHEQVVEVPSRSGYWFASLTPARICLNCRYEEHAWHWPGRIDMYSRGYQNMTTPKEDEPILNTKLNTEFVKRIEDRDEFYRLRT